MGNWMLEELITFASELDVGQILLLLSYVGIFYFSHQSRQVAGTGWKTLYAKQGIVFLYGFSFLRNVPDRDGFRKKDKGLLYMPITQIWIMLNIMAALFMFMDM